MKKTLFSGLILGLALLAFNSCAAIVGGGTYTAEVVAKDRENADIYYNGDYIGTGRAIVEIPRRQANNIQFSVEEEGYAPVTYNYRNRDFRVGAFICDILFFKEITYKTPYNYNISNIKMIWPCGVLISAACGSYWKPSINDRGVNKVDYDYFKYVLQPRGGSSAKNSSAPMSDAALQQKLAQVDDMYEKGIITEDERREMRHRYLTGE